MPTKLLLNSRRHALLYRLTAIAVVITLYLSIGGVHGKSKKNSTCSPSDKPSKRHLDYLPKGSHIVKKDPKCILKQGDTFKPIASVCHKASPIACPDLIFSCPFGYVAEKNGCVHSFDTTRSDCKQTVKISKLKKGKTVPKKKTIRHGEASFECGDELYSALLVKESNVRYGCHASKDTSHHCEVLYSGQDDKFTSSMTLKFRMPITNIKLEFSYRAEQGTRAGISIHAFNPHTNQKKVKKPEIHTYNLEMTAVPLYDEQKLLREVSFPLPEVPMEVTINFGSTKAEDILVSKITVHFLTHKFLAALKDSEGMKEDDHSWMIEGFNKNKKKNGKKNSKSSSSSSSKRTNTNVAQYNTNNNEDDIMSAERKKMKVSYGTKFGWDANKYINQYGTVGAYACFKNSYGRGAGQVPNDCSPLEQDGQLCYQSCAPGYYKWGLTCWRDCATYAGSSDTGTGCQIWADTQWKGGCCMWHPCNWWIFWVWDCNNGYCNWNCPDGYYDTPCSCYRDPKYYVKDSYPMVLGDDSLYYQNFAPYHLFSYRYPHCADPGPNADWEPYLCYPDCNGNDEGIGPVCWGTCNDPNGMVTFDCGGIACTPNQAYCDDFLDLFKEAVEDIVATVTGCAAAIASGGSAAGACLLALTKDMDLGLKWATAMMKGGICPW